MVVLIIEDDRGVADLCKNIVSVACPKADIIAESTSKGALALLASKTGAPISLILSDYNILDGTSVEVIKVAARKNMPVIAMSGKPENAEMMLEAGARVFVQKPFTNIRKLVTLLQEHAR